MLFKSKTQAVCHRAVKCVTRCFLALKDLSFGTAQVAPVAAPTLRRWPVWDDLPQGSRCCWHLFFHLRKWHDKFNVQRCSKFQKNWIVDILSYLVDSHKWLHLFLLHNRCLYFCILQVDIYCILINIHYTFSFWKLLQENNCPVRPLHCHEAEEALEKSQRRWQIIPFVEVNMKDISTRFKIQKDIISIYIYINYHYLLLLLFIIIYIYNYIN